MPSRNALIIFAVLMLAGTFAFWIADPVVSAFERTLVYVSCVVSVFVCALLAVFGPTDDHPEPKQKGEPQVTR